MLAVGLGKACDIAHNRLENDVQTMKKFRDRLQDLLFTELEGLVLNGHPHERLPNTLYVAVPGIDGNEILEGVPGVMASTGAACHDRSVTLSHVLAAMNVPAEIGMGALRLTVGRSNSMDQIEDAAGMLIQRVREIKGKRD